MKLPPDGFKDVFIGYDKDDLPYVMWWQGHRDAESKYFVGVGMDPKLKDRPFVFAVRQEMKDFIVRWRPAVED